MATHPYSLRSRLNGQLPSPRATVASAFPSKGGPKSPRKPPSCTVSLHLQRVIGTTTSGPAGLACCESSNSFAFCAGAVAVLSTLSADGEVTTRHYKSRPTAVAVNPSRPYYDLGSPSHTPPRRRASVFPDRPITDADKGAGVGRERVEEGSQTWAARERIKTVTCVALSENGKWLAVGESGYMPRVLLYSATAEALTDTPTSIISDHSIGVRSVAFSPDSRFLATLGMLTDGFVYIWSLNSRTGSLSLHSANKCTTPIADMIWCGTQLITIGTRHVKVWQPGHASLQSSERLSRRASMDKVSSPGPTTLSGRNALLGSLVECNFTCAVCIKPSLVLIGTDAGHLCALDVSEACPELKLLKRLEVEINALAWQPARQRLVLATEYGTIYEDLSSIDQMLDSPPIVPGGRARSGKKGRRLSAIRRSLGVAHLSSTGLSAVGCLSSQLILLDADGNIQVGSSTDGSTTGSELTLACHNGIIQGVVALPSASEYGDFLTWTRNGDIRFWDARGAVRNKAHIQLEQLDVDCENGGNELRVVRFSKNTSKLVAGDRFGVVQLLSPSNWETMWSGRAHGAEITDLALHDDSSLVATASRDQTIQLFLHRHDALELLQTMDDHIGAVNNVRFDGKGSLLVSCSADRTVFVREKAQKQTDDPSSIAYLPSRIITLRSAPLSMDFLNDKCDTLVVSTMDRRITKVEVSSGAVTDSRKITDPENEDTVALNRIAISGGGGRVEGDSNFLVAFSSADKSLRVYDTDKVLLLTREHGHTEGISDICILEKSTQHPPSWTLVSTGLDRTIMVWALTITQPPLLLPAIEPSASERLCTANGDVTAAKASPVLLPPLRKVLTKVDVIELSKNSGPASPSSPNSSPGSISPGRLARQMSRLALSTTIDEHDEDSTPEVATPAEDATVCRPREFEPEKSPSPQLPPFMSPKKLRPRSGTADDAGQRASIRRSPSPQPASQRRRTPANNGRLRRPPSVPTDLRGQAMASGSRRQSLSQCSDFGSVAMATEQTCRMLRAYMKKLSGSKEEVALDELEMELGKVLNVVRERKEAQTSTAATVTKKKDVAGTQVAKTQDDNNA